MKNQIITSFIALDFETVSGVCTLNGKRYNRLPCAMGFVKYMNGIPVRKRYCLINPQCEGTWACMKTNIDYTMARYGVSISSALHDLLDERSSSEEEMPDGFSLPIVAHNAPCEEEVLRTMLEIAFLENDKERSVTIFDGKLIDTLDILKRIGEKNNTLSEACGRHGIKLEHAHDALEDAEACGNLFLAIQNVPLPETSTSFVPMSAEKVAKKKRDADYLKPCPEEEIINKNNPFYHKNVIFTGKFSSIEREDLLMKLYYLGAYNKSSVSKSIEVAIVGEDAGPSKLEKIMDLAAQDKCLIVTEKMLIDILQSLE